MDPLIHLTERGTAYPDLGLKWTLGTQTQTFSSVFKILSAATTTLFEDHIGIIWVFFTVSDESKKERRRKRKVDRK